MTHLRLVQPDEEAPVIPTEIARLAAAVNLLRPEWQRESLQTFIAKNHANRPARDVAVALVYAALSPEVQTPAALNQSGPWWTAAQAGTATQTPPGPRDARCPTHPHEYAHHCRSCIADRKVPVSYLPDQAGSYEQTIEALNAARTKEETP